MEDYKKTHSFNEITCISFAIHNKKILIPKYQDFGDPWENRTPVYGVRGRRLSRLTNGPGGKGGREKREKSRHLPIFPGRFQPSIFGTTELNYCVRNGNRWDLCVIGTGYGCWHPLFSFEVFRKAACRPLHCTLKTEQRTACKW